MIRCIRALFPFESFALTIGITKRISLGLARSTERIEMEQEMNRRVAGTAGDTIGNVEVTTLQRNVEGRSRLIRPSVLQTIDNPLMGLDMIGLADHGIALDVVDLLYP